MKGCFHCRKQEIQADLEKSFQFGGGKNEENDNGTASCFS